MTIVALRADPVRPRPPDRPLVVALVGVAGVGKSSLASALARLESGVRVRPRITWWQYVANIPAMMSTFLRIHRPFRGLLLKEMKRLLRLHVLHRLVRETKDCRILVFDEGPVYLLARILVYGDQRIHTNGFEDSWRRCIATWAAELDVIVWLDAPDGVLDPRLRNRPQHPFVYTGDHSVRALLRAYRDAYARVIAELVAAGGPRPWTVSTARGSVDRTAYELLVRLRALREDPGGTPA